MNDNASIVTSILNGITKKIRDVKKKEYGRQTKKSYTRQINERKMVNYPLDSAMVIKTLGKCD